MLATNELNVMRRVAAGDTRAQIALGANLSQQHVKNILTSIYEKLGAANAPHAVAILDDQDPDWRGPVEQVNRRVERSSPRALAAELRRLALLVDRGEFGMEPPADDRQLG